MDDIKKQAAMAWAETIGARMADLDAAIEEIHYSPEGADDMDIKALKHINVLMAEALMLAEMTATRIQSRQEA